MSNLFNRGFSQVHEKMTSKSGKYIKSCYNCEYYYQATDDKDECCQNTNVTRYDVVITDNNICCSYWKAIQPKLKQFQKPKTVKELFMQRRNRGDK